MLPFDLLIETEKVLVDALSRYGHRELRIFWQKCDMPRDIYERFYKGSPQGSSRMSIINGIVEAIDTQGNVGALENILRNAISVVETEPEVASRLKKIQVRIQKRELVDEALLKSKKETKRVSSAEESALEQLRKEFGGLLAMADCQSRGYKLEQFLKQLFDVSGLMPSPAFRVTGEQIDGGFVLDSKHFLLEARWRSEKAQAADLYTFRAKVEGKLSGTIGLFLSINGFSDGAIQALLVGKEQVLILMDGADLPFVLEGRLTLTHLLREKLNEASFRGNPFLKASSLVPGNT